MNNAIVGPLVAHDKIDRYRSFGAFGKPTYQSYVQMRAMLRAKGGSNGERLANYFSKPTYDPDTAELRWTAEVQGTVRAWHEMSPDEQGRHALTKEVIRSALLGLVSKLRDEGGAQPGGAAAFASVLEQAMQVPAEDKFLFFVGDQPIIAFWGFMDANGRSVDPLATAPRYAPPPRVDEPSPPPPTQPATPDGDDPAQPDETDEGKRSKWWWFLLPLLGLLLLAFLLPRACTPDGGFDLKRAIPGLAQPDDAVDPLRGPVGPSVGSGAVPNAPGGGAKPPVSGTPSDTPTPPDASPSGELPKDPQLEKKADSSLDTKQKPETDPPTDPKQDPKTNPPKPDVKDDATPNSDKPMTDPPKPSAKGMKLPDDVGAQKRMDFLEGDWKAGEGLFDKQTRQPLDLSLKFTKDGQGEVLLRRPDGTECRGAVQGRMNGGKLGIEGKQAIPCSGGSAYSAPKIECQKERDGQTQCYGVNADGSRYYMDMQRR